MGQMPQSEKDFNILQRQQQMGSIYNKCGTKGDCGGAGQAQGPATGIGWMYPKTGGIQGSVLAKDGGVPGFTSWMGFESWVQNGANKPSGNGVVVLAAGSHAGLVGGKIMSALLGAEVDADLSSS
jgi:beta-lactamase class C